MGRTGVFEFEARVSSIDAMGQSLLCAGRSQVVVVVRSNETQASRARSQRHRGRSPQVFPPSQPSRLLWTTPPRSTRPSVQMAQTFTLTKYGWLVCTWVLIASFQARRLFPNLLNPPAADGMQ